MLYAFGLINGFILGVVSMRDSNVKRGSFFKEKADDPEQWLLYVLYGLVVGIFWPISLFVYGLRKFIIIMESKK
jgi:hypothetical protein